MIEWVLILNMSNTSQKIEMQDLNSCLASMNEIMKGERDNLRHITGRAICINTKTGEIKD